MIVEDPQHCEISELHMSLYRRTDGRTASLALQTEGEAHGRPPRSVQKQSRESELGARRETVKGEEKA